MKQNMTTANVLLMFASTESYTDQLTTNSLLLIIARGISVYGEIFKINNKLCKGCN